MGDSRTDGMDAEACASLGFRYVNDTVTTEIAAINNLVDAYHRALMTGSADPETVIPEYVEQMKAAGLDAVMADIQRQYDEWKAGKGE